jgi:L,D-transpeptidase YbiS
LKLIVSIPQQTLSLIKENQVVKSYSVSTALAGVGNEKNSGQTPLGKHKIRAKIGGNLPKNSVLVGRRPTGEIYNEDLAQTYPNRDWVLTRILWLSGLEKGINRLGNQDTMQRYIYIHGTPDSEPMGIPKSHGCIRMRNEDVIALFDSVPLGCEVEIINA